MSLNQVVSRIIANDTRSIFYDAICLYEFHVAVLHPDSFNNLLDAPELTDRAPDKLLRQARIYAAIRILEHLESTATHDRQSIGLQEVSQSPEYAKLYDEIILANGGWKQIRYMPSIKSFERDLTKRARRAKTAGQCIDFSFRFGTLTNPGRSRGGIALACEVVAEAEHYRMKRGLTKVKERWGEFKISSAFAYLYLIEDLLFRPKLTKKSFVEHLLKMAADKEKLRRFFRSYQELCDGLRPRKYAFPALTLPLGNEKFLTAKSFDETDVPQILADLRKTLRSQKRV